MNEMLVSTYNIWTLIIFICLYVSIPPRGEVTERDAGLLNIISAFIGVVMSGILSQRVLSGQIIESFEFTSGISSATDHYFFYLLGFILAFIFVIDVILYIKQRFQS